MIRGTTPTHVFGLPFDVSVIDKLIISYAQEGEEVLILRKEDCELEGNTISVTLSQENTFLFKDGKRVEIQIRILTTGDQIVTSDIKSVPVDRVLNSEVLV